MVCKNTMTFQGQDWNTVVLKRPKPPTVVEAKKPQSEYASRARKLEADFNAPANAEAPKLAPLPHLSSESIRLLINARTDQKMTRDTLAKKINEPIKTIEYLETGKVVDNKGVLQKVNKALNLRLKFVS